MGILFVAVALKVVLLSIDAFPFNSDEAIVGLMARHILLGERPIFFYGQAYMGSLDAILVALGFAVFGQSVLVIRGLQVLLFAGTVWTTMQLGWRIFGTRCVVWIAGLLMAVPTVNVTLYTTVSLGGYGEALFIGNIILLLTLRIHEDPESWWPYVVWGGFVGLGFWGFGLTLVYSIPSCLFVVWTLHKRSVGQKVFPRLTALVMGLVVGASPWVAYAVTQGPSILLEELAGSAIAGASPEGFFAAILSRAYNFLLLGTTVIWGLRPPWGIRWLALPLLPFALAFWLIVSSSSFLSLRTQDSSRQGRILLLSVVGTLIAGFVLTPFGADPSGRYFLPLAVPLALFAADFICGLRSRVSKFWQGAVVVGMLAFNLWGTLETSLRKPPGITTQFDSITWIDHRRDDELIAFLERHGETRGYSNYWVAYPLAFLTDERMIYVPRLPYHQDFRYTHRYNRYAPYNQEVEDSERVAYITTNHPDLDSTLREGLRALGVTWKEARIGNYLVYYALSDLVHPEELGAFWLND